MTGLRSGWAASVVLAAAVIAGSPAYAQLGTTGNVPPQHLFNFGDQPKPINNGLGTMAERRKLLAQSRQVHRAPVHTIRP